MANKVVLGLILYLLLVSPVWGQPIFDYTDRFSFRLGTVKSVTDCDGLPIPVPESLIVRWEVQLTKDTGEVYDFSFPPDPTYVQILSPQPGVYTGKIRIVSQACCDGSTPCNWPWKDFYGIVRFSQ